MARKKITKSQIKTSLLGQLTALGADVEHFQSLVNDYCELWEIKEALAADIKTRGVVYKDVSSTGVQMMKNNPSIKEIVGVDRQMLAILKELGLTTSNVRAAGDDDEL